jgi:hypothetical protein
VSNYFDWSAADPKLPLPVLGFQLPPPPEDDSKKPKPIRLGGPNEVVMEVRLAIPAKYGVRLPIGVDVKRDYIEYHSSYKLDAGQLIATRRMRVVLAEIPYDRREDFASFRRTVEADQAQNIVLENKSPGTAGLGSGQSPDDLFESAVQAGNNNNFPLAIELFERVAKQDPKHKGLWNNLGRAYLADSQYQAADASRSRSRSTLRRKGYVSLFGI